MSRNVKLGVWLLAAAIVAAAGFLIGRQLKASEKQVFAFDLTAPAFQPVDPEPGLSRGGFTGLDLPTAEEGRLVLSGRVVEKTGTSVTIESTWGGRSTLRIASAEILRLLQAAGREELQRGAVVVVRTKPGSNEVLSVIILAPP